MNNINFIPNQYKGNYLIMPAFITDNKTLSMGAKILFVTLCGFARDKNTCYPSKKKLIEKMNCSLRSLYNYIGELVKHGFLAVSKLEYGNSLYQLFAPKQVSSNANFSEANANFANDRANFAHRIISKNNKQESIPPYTPQKENGQKDSCENSLPLSAVGGGDFSGTLLEVFKQLFAAYPRKEAEYSALVNFEKAVRAKALPPVEKLLATVEAFKSTFAWQKENGRYVPRLDRWIKDRRWLDAEIQEKVKEREEAKIRAAKRLEAEMQEQKEREIALEKRQIKRTQIEQEKAKLEQNPSLKAKFEALVAKFNCVKNFDLTLALDMWLYFPLENIPYCFAENIDPEKYQKHFSPLFTAISDWRVKHLKQQNRAVA